MSTDNIYLTMVSMEQRAIFVLLNHGIPFSRITLGRTNQPPIFCVKVDDTPAVTVQLVLVSGPQIAVVVAFHPPYESLLFSM